MRLIYKILPVAVFAAAMLTGCAQHGKVAAFTSIRTEMAAPQRTSPPKPKPFKDYKSLAGQLSGRPGMWNILEDSATSPLRSVLSISNAGDSLERVTLYSAEFSPGTFKTKDVENALAYLFKADVADSVPAPPGFPGFKILLPPDDSATHCGLLRLTDTTLTFLNLRGVGTPRTGGCAVAGLNLDTADAMVGNPWNEEKRRKFLAVLINTMGLKSLEDAVYTDAMRFFGQAFALDSTVPEYLLNQAVIHALRDEHAAGIALLLRYPKLVESSGQLCGILGSFYEDIQHYQEAREWALKAVAKDPENHEWLINLSDALWGLGEKAQSKNVLLRPYAEKPDFRLAVYLAGTHLGLEEYENALEVLGWAHTHGPPTAKSTAYALRTYLGLKRFEEGLEFIRALDTAFPVTAENLFLKSACEFNLRLYRQAAESVRLSLKLNGSDREAQELQTRIAALLGDKSNQLLRSPIAPLQTSLTVSQTAKMLRDSAWDVRLSGNPILLIAQQVLHEWIPQGRWKQTRRIFFLVPDGARLIRYSELIFNLNSSFERFHVNRLRIYDSAWTPVHEGSLADYYVTRNPNADLHPENLLAHIVLKTRPGRMYVEMLYTREAQVASAEFPYVRFDHQATYPVAYSQFQLLHPPRNLLISPFGDVRFDSLPDRLILTMPTPALPDDGPFLPQGEAFGSGFSASPFTTWRDVGLRYLEDLKKAGIDPANPPLAVRERASEIADHRPFESPVQPLFRYVRDSIRYDNYEFTLEAGIPDSAPVVLAKGSADCKGHALLLTQMLRARGIEAHLSLVNLNHSGDVGQPNLNQFNHIIVQIPRMRGAGPYFLDPTEKFAAFRRYPLGLEGHNTLVLDPANPQLVSIPEIDSADEHSVRIFHRLDVDSDRTAAGRDSLILRGKAASEFRERLSTWSRVAKHQNLVSWLASGYSAFTEDSFRILDENNPDAPLTLILGYHRHFSHLDTAQPFDYFPKLELGFLRFPDAAQRKSPVYFPHEATVESNWTYHLPAGFGWKSLSLARQLDQEYLRWQFSIQQNEPQTISLRQQWQIEPFLADPPEYRQLRAEWDPVIKHCGLRLTISRL